MAEVSIEDHEVTWDVIGIPVHGTITRPSEGTARSAVILVAGSGPTDRNWCSPLLPGTNGSAKLLAESLARQGFLTLRYDKVASGPYAMENFPKFAGKLSMQTHLDELAGAAKAIAAEKISKKDNLFVLASSEGTIHAVNYQLQGKGARFKGLVLTGSPGRAMGDVGRSQVQKQIMELPGGDSLMREYDEAMADFLAGRPVTVDPALPEGVRMLLLALSNPVNLPFGRELWAYDLSKSIAGIEEPILVVIGKKDVQVDWRADGGALEKAAANKAEVTFVYPETANHVLKYEATPLSDLTPPDAAMHYNVEGSQLDDEAAAAIFSWLKKQADR